MNSNAVRGFLKAVILVGTLFIILYFVSYNKWLDHDFDSVDTTYRVDDSIEENSKNNSEDNKKYQSLYSKISFELLQYNFGEEFYDVYYNNKEFYDEYYIYVGIVNLIKNDIIVNCNFERDIKGIDLKKEINTLFGNIKYNNKSFTTKNNKITISYDSIEDKYNIKVNGTCSGYDYSNGGIKNIYKKYEISGDYLYIYEKALYVDTTKDKNGNILFNYHKDINKSSNIIANSFDKVDELVLPTYVYKFAKSNDQYIIKSISRLN